MTRALHRRLDRLTDQVAVGRMITLSIADEHVNDDALIDATLAAAGIEREERDLVILVKRYGTLDAEPPCTLLSVLALAPNGRNTRQ
jgi:hypothetical protein